MNFLAYLCTVTRHGAHYVKRDIIHKTGNNVELVVTLPEKVRTKAAGNMHGKFGQVRNFGHLWFLRYVSEQTDSNYR